MRGLLVTASAATGMNVDVGGAEGVCALCRGPEGRAGVHGSGEDELKQQGRQHLCVRVCACVCVRVCIWQGRSTWQK
jgi:hypothetical protein